MSLKDEKCNSSKQYNSGVIDDSRRYLKKGAEKEEFFFQKNKATGITDWKAEK